MQSEREQLLQHVIRQYALGALIFWRPDELVLTLDYLPHWGISFFVYPSEGEPVLFIPELEPPDILPGGIAIRTFPWGNLQAPDPWQQLYAGIRAFLQERKVQSKSISFIPHIGGTAFARSGGEQAPLPHDLHDALSALGAGFRNTTTDLLKMYLYKTTLDRERLDLTHKVAATAVDAFHKAAIPGNTEAQVAAAVESVVLCSAGETQIHFAKAWAQIQSGSNAAAGGCYNRSSSRKLQVGELVMMELAVCVNGYWADITRTTQLGEVSAQLRDAYLAVQDAKMLAIDSMKPGVTMGSIDAIARNHIKKHGYGGMFNHPLGHHTGFRYHDPGPPLAPSSNALLEAGMLMTVEPGVYSTVLEGGARIEENVLITENGYTILSCY